MLRIIGISVILLLQFSHFCIAEESSNMKSQIDQHSFRLGGLSTFAEMVRVGVKTLALSAAMTPDEMNAFVDDVERIA